MKLAFRPATADDRRFVISAWSSSFKVSYSAGIISSEDWAPVMWTQIGKLLERPETTTVVAFERDEPTFLYGFVSGDVTEPKAPIVHYVYAKEAFRRAGVAQALLKELGIVTWRPFRYTCKTPILTPLADKIPHAKWDPTFARYPRKPNG